MDDKTLEYQAVLLCAAADVAKKEKCKERLEKARVYPYQLGLHGRIDGRDAVYFGVAGTLVRNNDSVRSTSVMPKMPQLVALLMSKLNGATQAKVLSELPGEYFRQGGPPAVDPELQEAVDHMLAKIRQTKEQSVSGSIRNVVSPFSQSGVVVARQPA